MSVDRVPEKGEVYRHPRLRGAWEVQSCGPKWITLKSNLPHLEPQRIPTTGFVSAIAWERVR